MTSPPAAEARARLATEADAALAAAARAGDPDALEALFRVHVGMVYNLVRQALSDSPDVDDLVQDVLLRALRQLPGLRDPASFRPWLAAIAMHQISTHLSRAQSNAERTAPLEAAAWKPDADIEGPALLRVELSGQRRQVRSASRWLSAEDRMLLSLWWLENAGEFDRSDVAAALGVTPGHAAVRLQRMREQLDLSRTIVAALEAMPGCEQLNAVTADWNGVPSPFWRKKIARHTRGCPVCSQLTKGQIPTERLLAGGTALPVPAALADAAARIAASWAGPTSTGSQVFGRMLAALRQHPGIAATIAGGALLAAIGWGVADRAATATSSSAAPILLAPSAAAPAPPVLPSGRVSLEAYNLGGRFVTYANDLGVLGTVKGSTGTAARRRATFEVVHGLADRSCYSFRTSDGRWLRHSSWRLRPAREELTVLFRRDATFCARAGAAEGTLSLESYNYPGWFVRHADAELWVDQDDHTAKFRSDSSFRIRSALG